MFPIRLLDQDFGRCITSEDLIQPFFGHGSYGPNYYRPWKWYMNNENDWGSTIVNEKDKFKVTLDVQQFKPSEISVKVADNQIIIEGKHEERQDDHGFISRQFTRRYTLPKECRPQDVSSRLTSDGILMVMAGKRIEDKSCKNEINVPIEFCSPISKQTNDTKQDNGASNEKDLKCTLIREREKSDKTKKGQQIISKEDHSRLLKPEFTKQSITDAKTENSSAALTELNESSKMVCSETIKQQKSDECSMASKLDSMKAFSTLATEKAEASSSKTSEIFSESSTTTTSSSSSEMMQSEEISAFITSMTSSMKANENACNILSDIISQELKEAAENV